MYLYPDPDSFVIFPWAAGRESGRLICDVYNADGTPFEELPRNTLRVLKRQRIWDIGYCVGPEAEFFSSI